jgi:hypothetical protein
MLSLIYIFNSSIWNFQDKLVSIVQPKNLVLWILVTCLFPKDIWVSVCWFLLGTNCKKKIHVGCSVYDSTVTCWCRIKPCNVHEPSYVEGIITSTRDGTVVDRTTYVDFWVGTTSIKLQLAAPSPTRKKYTSRQYQTFTYDSSVGIASVNM